MVEALAIDRGRIVARGTSAEMARYAGPNTKVIDVAGATVIPGLIDNHFHFTRGVETWHQQARFEGVDSRREALAVLAAKAASLQPGDWIMVQGGWTPRQFADAPGGFTLAELDGVAPKNPLFVQEGYAVVYANSLALKAVGLDPAGRRAAQRGGPGVVPAAVCAVRRDAHDLAGATRAEPHRLHARAQFGRAHGRLQPGPIATSSPRARRRVRCRFGSGSRSRSTRTVPASAAKAAALIARTRPNQFDGQYGIFGLGEVLYGPFFDLAPRKDPWPAEIMNEYGKLATVAASAGWHVHQHVINNSAVTRPARHPGEGEQTQPLTACAGRWATSTTSRPPNIARAKALGLTLGVHGAAMQAGAHMPLRRLPTAASCSAWERTRRSCRTTTRS